MKLRETTLVIWPDEPALLLEETNVQSGRPKIGDKGGWRRMQVITVKRGEKLVNWMKDLGPAASFKAGQFNLLGGVELTDSYGNVTGVDVVDTVGSIRDQAERERETPHEDWLDRLRNSETGRWDQGKRTW
jgi:hypothetical protein